MKGPLDFSGLSEKEIYQWYHTLKEVYERAGSFEELREPRHLVKYVRLSPDSIFKEIEYLVQLCYTNYPENQNTLSRVSQRVWTIFTPGPGRKIIIFLWRHGASTFKELHHRLKIPKPTIYYYLDKFEALGIVRKTTTFTPPTRTHRRPGVYAIAIAPPEASIEAQKRYLRLLREIDPKVHEAERISQLLLEDYFEVITRNRTWENWVYEREIFPILKREYRGERWFDVVPLIKRKLTGEGLEWVK